METIPTETMEAAIMTSEFIEHCMGTPTVLRKILEQFSNPELLTISLVNKQWSFEARSVLKARSDVIAKIPSCQSLVALTLGLKRMRVVPFSGIHIRLCHYDDKACQSSFSESKMDLFCNEILDRLPRNHLAITFNMISDDCKDCQTLKLVQKIVTDFKGTLEELVLTCFGRETEEMYEQVFQDWTFPRLTTLKIKAFYRDRTLTKFLKALVSRAPSLRTLKTSASFNLQENVLKGSSAVLVPTEEFNPFKKRVCQSLISYLRAETIELTLMNLDFEIESLIQDMPMALQASHTSLKTLRTEFLFAASLMRYEICLKNVTNLEIWMPSDLLESTKRQMSTILTSFEFTRAFPKLQQVIIVSQCEQTLTAEQISYLVEQGISSLRSISPDQAARIKHLTLRDCIWDSELPYWARMFPLVDTLSLNIGTRDLSQFPFTLLWEKFVDVKELILENIHWCSGMSANLDGVFCGIFPQEVAELRMKNDEYLKAVNIVPVMPSIACMKGLRTLKFNFTLPYDFRNYLNMEPFPECLFSRVTGWIGFARCPALAVTSSVRIELHER